MGKLEPFPTLCGRKGSGEAELGMASELSSQWGLSLSYTKTYIENRIILNISGY